MPSSALPARARSNFVAPGAEPPPTGRHSAVVRSAAGHSARRHPADRDLDGRASALSPDAPPTRPRLRIGIGASIVVIIVVLVAAVLISLFAPHGRTDSVALASSRSGASASSATAAGSSASPAPGSSGQAPSGDASTAGGHAGATASGSGGSGAGTNSGAGGVAGTGAGAGAGASAGTAAGAGVGAPILIHVIGAVAHPGLFELHKGARVIDAVTAAGGFTPTADQSRQNLARPISDGEQVYFPETGNAATAPAAGGAGSAAAGSPGSSGGAGSYGSGGAASAGGSSLPGSPTLPAALVNLNTADEPTLETLPHVGPALAQRILAWRAANGDFTQPEDLKNVSGIGDKTFETLQPFITV